MKVLFVGGGTLGPVTPLLAVAHAWKTQNSFARFVWVGTKNGPERAFVENADIPFKQIATARLVRYVSTEWLLMPARFLLACVQSAIILSQEKPDIIASAGGYTAVPVVLVGYFMGIPSWIHQSDAKPVLTNRLLAPFAKWITVAWKKTARAFPASKTFVVGNPVREVICGGVKERAQLMFGCDPKKPTVFVFGGGTGSEWINTFVESMRDELLAIANVIHVTGKGKKGAEEMLSYQEGRGRYFVVETMSDEMADAYAIADVVVSRAGTGAISELAALKKAAVIIPLPNTPQQQNAEMIRNASVVLNQTMNTPQIVFAQVRRLLMDPLKRVGYGQRLSFALETNCAEKIIKMLEDK